MRLAIRAFLLLVAVAAVHVAAFPALAHENRDVGPYRLTVGFNVEPAFEGQVNGAQLRVRRIADQSPVTGLADAMRVDVTYSGRTKPMSLRAVFGQDGLYVADFVPTASGRYEFHFHGTIEGTAVAETFQSGPGRFNDVQPLAQASFPDVPANVVEIGQTAQDAMTAANDASDAASSARILGIIGIAVGALGAVLGGAGLAMAARRRP